MSARLIGRTGATAGQDFPLMDVATIGASNENEIRIAAPGVSRRHARIVADKGQYFLEDAGATNGTFLNGGRVQREALQHLDVITLGRAVDLIFIKREGETPAPAADQITAARLTIADGPEAGTVVDVPKGELTIGRAPSCNLVLASGLISKVHARVQRTANQVVLQDLQSINGTFVNGSRVDSVVVLKSGDTINFAGVRSLKATIEGAGAMKAAAPSAIAADEPAFNQEWKTRFVWAPDELALIEQARAEAMQLAALRAPGAAGAAADKKPAPAPAAARPAVAAAPAKAEAAPAPAAKPAPPAAPKPAEAAKAGAVAAPPVAPKPAPPVAPKVEGAQPAPNPAGPVKPAPPVAAAARPGVAPEPVKAAEVRPPPAAEPPIKPGAPVPVKAEPAAAPPPAAPPAAPKPPVAAKPPAAPPAPAVAKPGDVTMPLKAPDVGEVTLPLGAMKAPKLRGIRLLGSEAPLVLGLGTFVVGRAVGSDVRLDDRQVSRSHARITIDEASATIEDLQTVNGTMVNGKEVKARQPLNPGDKVQIGASEFTVELTTS